MLLRQGDAFIVDEGGVLDRRGAGANRILDAFGRMRVRFDTEAEIRRLLHRGAQFLGSKFDRLRIAAMSENGARRQDLDVIGAAVREFADVVATAHSTELATPKRRSNGNSMSGGRPVIAPAPSLMVT